MAATFGSYRGATRLASGTVKAVKRPPILVVIGLILGLVGLLPAQTPAGAQTPPDNATVDPRVAEAIEAEGSTDFWVVFDARADLGGADDIADWGERGQYVYDRLTGTAGDSQAGLVAELTRRNVDFESIWIVNALLVRNGDQAILDLARARPEVAEIAATRTYELPEPIDDPDRARIQAIEWGVANVKADQVWSQFGVRGEGVVVANIDTGVEYTHPALVNQYRGNNGDGTFDHNYNWRDPGGDACPDAPCDTDGHGTHTMGTMVGDDGAGNQIGVAPGAQWMSAMGCPFGGCPDVDLFESAQFVMAPTDLQGENPRPDLRAQIVNNSWGSNNGPFEDPFFNDVVDSWTAAGIFGVFSNGNSGPGCDTAGSPADYDSAWGVGAYDINNTIAFFSSRGPAGEESPYIKPDVAAPGVDVRSSLPGASYGNLSGTSMAAPHQSGTVALMWAAAPSLLGDIAGTRQVLDDSAVDADDTSCGGTADDNNVFGEGRLDALAAVDQSPRGPSGALEGTVTGRDGSPLAGATVTAEVEGRERSTRTTPEGAYRFGALPVGTVEVTASAIGYRPATESADIVEGETTTVDFALQPLPRLSGTVTDANDDEPVVGVAVTATSGDRTETATTGADGTYALFIELGTWSVTFEKEGYATETREVVVDEDGEQVTLDVALRSGVASVDPPWIDTTLLADTERTFDVDLTNTGSGPLEWEAFERGGGTVDGELQWLRRAPERGTQATGNARAAGAGNRGRQALPSAARWTPDVAGPDQASVLVYADDPFHPSPNTYVDQALQRLGLGYTAYYDANFAGFEAALADGGWDIVIFENDNWTPPASTFDALNEFVTGGGKLIAHSWQVEATAGHPLWANLGIDVVSSDFDPPDPVHYWEADHPLFTDPETVPELTDLEQFRYGVYGQHVDALTGFEALGGYTETPAPGEAALVVGNDDRTLFRGFLDGQNDADLDADAIPDGVELWANSILGIEQGFFVDVPWLDVSPDSGTVEPGDTEGLEVSIDTTGLEVGVYSASIVLDTNAARQPRVSIPIRLVVTPYLQGINAGGPAYTDVAQDEWAADQAFDGEWGYEYESRSVRTRRAIAGTDDDPLYQDARTGQTFAYRFDQLPDGVYEVELHLAEIERRRPTQRLFDVTADSTPLLVGYDISEDVGLDHAVVHRFTVEVTDGLLRVRFLSRGRSSLPIVGAVQLTHRPDLTD
jgi:hypothetical protein